MTLNGMIIQELKDLEKAYQRLSELKCLDIYSSDTITLLERIEEEIRWREYGIAHMRAHQLKNNPPHEDETPRHFKLG